MRPVRAIHRLRRMKRLGQAFMILGAGVGATVAIAMAGHYGLVGAPWIINVALAKLGIIAAGGLMAAGAVSVRIANRREQSNLLSGRR
jgi:hypothetical protein